MKHFTYSLVLMALYFCLEPYPFSFTHSLFAEIQPSPFGNQNNPSQFNNSEEEDMGNPYGFPFDLGSQGQQDERANDFTPPPGQRFAPPTQTNPPNRAFPSGRGQAQNSFNHPTGPFQKGNQNRSNPPSNHLHPNTHASSENHAVPTPSNMPSGPSSPLNWAKTGEPKLLGSPNQELKQSDSESLTDYLELDPSVRGLEVKNFDLPDRDIRDVVLLISKWTGKNFILDSKISGKITILGPSQVTLQEAYEAFLSALDANELTTVQSGKFIRIIKSSEVRHSAVKTYVGDYSPSTDQYITRIFQLKYINAEEVNREFRDMTSRNGKLFAYEPTNSIIITDRATNINRIQEILNALDVKSFEASLHVLPIKHSSAKVIAEMLTEIYREGSPSTSHYGNTSQSVLTRVRGGGIISKVMPDENTNSLIIMANTSGFESIERLVAKLDTKNTENGNIHVYYCKYAKADDLATTLAAMAQGTATSGKSSASKRPTSSSSSNNSSNSPFGNSSSNSSSSSSSPFGSNSSASNPVTAVLGPNVKVTSDGPTNSLVITANSSDYQTLLKVIYRLDIPRIQVFVESAIMELSTDILNQVSSTVASGSQSHLFNGGFVGDSTSLYNFLSLQNGIPEGATIPFFAGQQSSSTLYNQTSGTTPGYPLPTINVAQFMGIITLLTSTANASVLSTPQIIALDNEQAEFKVQNNIPVLSSFTAFPMNGTSTGIGGSFPTGSVQPLKVGIDIKLTPHVNAASKTVRLDIEEDVSSVIPSANVPKALQATQMATINRTTNTSIIAHDEDYILMSGLMTDNIIETVKKIPFLGDLPLIGWLFKSRTSGKKKSNLVILLHPQILDKARTIQHVKDALVSRDKFVNQDFQQEDPDKEVIKGIKSDLKEQRNRKDNELPAIDYYHEEEKLNHEKTKTSKRKTDSVEDESNNRSIEQNNEGESARNESSTVEEEGQTAD